MTFSSVYFTDMELGSCLELVIDHRGKTPRKLKSDWVESGIPTISAKNVNSGKLVAIDAIRYVTHDVYKKWMSVDVARGDCFLVSEGATLGHCMYWDEDYPIVLGQRIFCLRANPEILYSRYLYAYMNTLAFQSEIVGRATGSSVSGLRQTEVLKLNIKVPPMAVQKFIGDTLYNLNKKSEVNSHTNQIPEQMAQAIFKSWFVDFDPVKAKMNGEQPEGMDAATASLFPEKLVESEIGLIPEGWVETPLYDIAEYINGAAYKKFEPNNEGIGLPIVKIAELKAGITQKTGFSTVDMPAKYRLEDNDILFSWSGNPDTSIDTFVWALGEAWLNQHIFKVVPKSVLSRDYVLCLLKFMRPVFAEIARDKQTTGLGHVTVKDLKRLTVAVPSKELLTKFNEKVSALIAQNFSLVKQNQNLEKLRDTLLPKLLSGEIELGQAQELAEVE
ncbi:restriction endonuclease subunit S [Vibrio diabolicus]|uniref:restriction endonuclease subunit S n=1 Tax=Vibrio diabolicus TaxID=50719 RepID=UPI003747876D